MTTRHERVRAYYSAFDEWSRLNSPEGVIEHQRAWQVLDKYLPPEARVLDLGGGPGRYAAELASRGHRVVLADISPELLETARERLSSIEACSNVESIDEVNGQDLARYDNDSFDAVLAFGPYYHLLDEDERRLASLEIGRVLRPDGFVFVAYISRVSGLIGLIQRAAGQPEQVSAETLRTAAETGVFRNASDAGFQEGFYPMPGELEELFEACGFEILDSVSLKSVAHGLCEDVLRIGAPVRAEVDRLIEDLSRRPEVLAMGGHALLVGKKRISCPLDGGPSPDA